MRAWEFWAKRTDERGREIDVTVIAYGRSLTEALTRVLALGIHRDVVVYEDVVEHLWDKAERAAEDVALYGRAVVELP